MVWINARGITDIMQPDKNSPSWMYIKVYISSVTITSHIGISVSERKYNSVHELWYWEPGGKKKKKTSGFSIVLFTLGNKLSVSQIYVNEMYRLCFWNKFIFSNLTILGCYLGSSKIGDTPMSKSICMENICQKHCVHYWMQIIRLKYTFSGEIISRFVMYSII